MGNVRNPVGPLPSSIYWRRRAVVGCLLALVAALVAWMLTSHGGGGSGGHGTGAQGSGHPSRTPLPSITPGPTTSQTGITTVPGGRDGGSGDGGSAAGAGSDGGGTGGGTGGGSGSGGAAGGAGGTGGSGGGAGAVRLPVGTSVPDCAGSQAHLTLRSVRASYQPGDKPQFAISAVNSGGSACKVDFSAVSAVLTVVDSHNGHMWASDDCPPSRSPYLLEVPAGSSTTYDVTWKLGVSAPHCATPSGSRSAAPGSYLAKVSVPGLGSAHSSFVLADA